MPSLKPYLLGGLILIFIAMGVGLYHQRSVIAAQSDTISIQATQIGKLEAQMKAREAVAKTHTKDINKARRERDEYAQRLKEAQEGDGCANAPLNDDTRGVLKELYNSQPSF